jgi:hypothetical protein
MKKSRFKDSQIVDALQRAEADDKVLGRCREFAIGRTLFSH